MPTNTVKLHRVLRATPERVYRAFLDAGRDGQVAAAARLHRQGPPASDASVGGTYKMSFTNFTTGKSHSFGGKYLELVPNERMRYTDEFDDPNLPGEMQTTVTLRRSRSATEINIVQEGIPTRFRRRLLSRLAGVADAAGAARRAGDQAVGARWS